MFRPIGDRHSNATPPFPVMPTILVSQAFYLFIHLPSHKPTFFLVLLFIRVRLYHIFIISFIIAMVKRCAWGLCNTDDRYPERLAGGVKFIPFPKPRRQHEKCLRWIDRCGRIPEQLNVRIVDGNKNLYVCSKVNNSRLRKIPIFSFFSRYTPQPH